MLRLGLYQNAILVINHNLKATKSVGKKITQNVHITTFALERRGQSEQKLKNSTQTSFVCLITVNQS